MREMVEFLAKSLSVYPDQVEVEEEVRGTTRIFHLRTAPEDVGRLIGRHGRVIQAIRTLTKAAAIRTGERVQVEIGD